MMCSINSNLAQLLPYDTFGLIANSVERSGNVSRFDAEMQSERKHKSAK